MQVIQFLAELWVCQLHVVTACVIHFSSFYIFSIHLYKNLGKEVGHILLILREIENKRFCQDYLNIKNIPQ